MRDIGSIERFLSDSCCMSAGLAAKFILIHCLEFCEEPTYSSKRTSLVLLKTSRASVSCAAAAC